MTALRAAAARLFDQPALLLTLAAVFWASNAIAGRLAVGEVSPMLLTFLRWALVSVALWALFWRRATPHWRAVQPRWRRVAVMGAIGFAAFNAFFYAASVSTTAINIAVLQAATPAMVLAGVVLLQGARLDRAAAIGVPVTLVGVVVVASQGEPWRLFEIGLNPGDALMLCANLCYASYTLLLPGRPAIPALPFFMMLAPAAALAALPLAVTEAAAGLSQGPTLAGWAVALWIALFPSCVSQLFFLRGVDLIGAQKAGVYGNLIPVFTPLMAVLVLGQSFEAFHAAALALVLGGLWVSQR